MEVIARTLRRLYRWQHLWLALILLTSLLMHASIIGQPDTPMFDEQYYVKDAQAIAEGNGELRREHPPVGQLLVAAGIMLFGDNPVGWRFFAVLFGVAGTLFFYLICHTLGMSSRAALIATFLLGFEALMFIQSSIAMLDIFSITLMLVSFWLYLKRRYPLSAAAVALSTLTKLTGGLALFVIVLHWLLLRRDRPVAFCSSVLLAPALFVFTLPGFDYLLSGSISNPVNRITEMLTAGASLTFANTTHPHASRPWEWVLGPQMMPYWWEPQYVAFISFTVGVLVIPVMCLMVYRATKRDEVATFSATWFLGTFLIWIPLVLITDRVTYLYYFCPTVGAICIGLGWFLDRFLTSNVGATGAPFRRGALPAVIAYLALHLAILVALTPLWSRWIPLYDVTLPG